VPRNLYGHRLFQRNNYDLSRIGNDYPPARERWKARELTAPECGERKYCMDRKELFESMKKCILEGEKEEAVKLAKLSLEMGIDPRESINAGFTAGIQEVGRLWEEGEYFLPELVVGAEAMKGALQVLDGELQKSKKGSALGRIVIGTIEGDIHDIGKSLVASIFSANGFDVIDLGLDVPVEKFVQVAKETQAQVIGISALLTTTMTNQKKVIDLLEKEGIRKNFKIIVGGAPVTREWAQRIGADDAPPDAFEAVASVKHLLGLEVAV
jgi:corrinoid protein of di/trimethylamine methyltransferase